MAYKKKLHLLNPKKEPKKVEVYKTKREVKMSSATPESIERQVRESLAHKVSGTLIGIWLLVPEYLRLGSWDLLKQWSGKGDTDIEPRLALQLVNEAALCVRGVRQSRSLCHQGFELANGLPYIATDKEIHNLLTSHTIAQAQQLQIALGSIREKRKHYDGKVLAFDPNRIVTHSKRIMPKKKKNPTEPSKKVVQNFFCIDTHTGQPLGFTVGSSGKTVTKASCELVEIIKSILPSHALLLSDTEHFTVDLINYLNNENQFDILMPAPLTKKIETKIQQLDYQRMWAGYSIAETPYTFDDSSSPVRLIAQRTGENISDYSYKAFITTGNGTIIDLLTEQFPERWTIEEFFNFEGYMGWNRASTLNLNVRYGKLSLSLIAQAAVFQLREKIPGPYKKWTAKHIADSIFHGIDGDIRVSKDTIIVTMYNVPDSPNLKTHYENLPKKLEAEGVNPKIPWLYDFKLDFKFK